MKEDLKLTNTFPRDKRFGEMEICAQITDANFYSKLIETVPVLVYAYRNSKVVYVNPAVEETLGYTFEEMVEKNFWDICHPDYRDLIKERGLCTLTR